MTQSVSVQFFMLVAHALLVWGAAVGFMRWLGSRLRGRDDMPPVAPFFVSVTTVFALFLAFHAQTIWTRQHAAEAAFHDALTAISRLNSSFGAEGLGLEKARLHLSRYADAVVREEWAIRSAQASPRANQEIKLLREQLILASERLPAALSTHLWRVFDDLIKARSARLSIGQQNHSEQSWTLVLVLGFLSHIAIGLVHVNRPSAGRLAIALFACATTVSYWALTRSIDPFARLDAASYMQAVSGFGG